MTNWQPCRHQKDPQLTKDGFTDRLSAGMVTKVNEGTQRTHGMGSIAFEFRLKITKRKFYL